MSGKKSSPLATLLLAIGTAIIEAAEEFEQELLENDTADEPKGEPKKTSTRGKKKEEPEPKEEPKKTSTRGKKKEEPEPKEEEDDEVTLEDLQELAAMFLENAKRKDLKAILADFDLKTIGEAEEQDFDEIYDALYDKAEELELIDDE